MVVCGQLHARVGHRQLNPTPPFFLFPKTSIEIVAHIAVSRTRVGCALLDGVLESDDGTTDNSFLRLVNGRR